MIAAQAELTQAPFDMPIAESELVGGFQVEYTGFRFLLFFMAEFGTAFAFSALPPCCSSAAGGPWLRRDRQRPERDRPGRHAGQGAGRSAFVIFWVRFTYPRLREDQLQKFAWKFLIPLALLNITVTGILKVAF